MKANAGGGDGPVEVTRLRDAVMAKAAEAHDAITHPPQGVRDMSKWAKQQVRWNDIKSRKPDYDDDFEACLAPIDEAKRQRARHAAKRL